MGRVPRPAEDAVLQGLRRELESYGFRYKARELVKRSDQLWVVVNVFRARWIEPDEEIFTVLVESRTTCRDGEEGGALMSLAEVVRGGRFYGQAHVEPSEGSTPEHFSVGEDESLPDLTEPIDPKQVVDDFRRTLLPIVLANTSAEKYAEALLAEELAPGVAHFMSPTDRAFWAYRWAECGGNDELIQHATDVMRQLAHDPDQHDAVTSAWQALELPGCPL